MRKIAVIPNIIKDKDFNATKKIVNMLKNNNIVPLLSTDIEHSGIDAVYSTIDEIGNAEMIIVLGGDGSLLAVVRQFQNYNIPVLGMNYGHLGFLTEIEKDDEEELNKILNGEYLVEKHMMLTATVGDNVFHALNDATVHRCGDLCMHEFSIYINNEFVNSFLADGLIVSTPTGSTGYSLSAGGPIIYPTLDVLAVTPICAHELHSRCIIVPADKKIKICVKSKYDTKAMLTMDGQVGHSLESNDEIVLTGSKNINLVRISDNSFFQKLRIKFFQKEC